MIPAELLAIVFGMLVGSFLNVCILRLPLGESIVTPRSKCPSCRTVLGPAELVPVASWLIQRGRCRHCAARISPRYALVEILTGSVFWFVYVAYVTHQDYSTAATFLVFYCALIVITFIDLDHFLILDVITYPGMIAGMLLSLWGHDPLTGVRPSARLAESFQGLVIGGGILWLIQFLGTLWYRRQGLAAMGLGDVKFAAFSGAFLGPRMESAALLYAVFIGGASAIVFILAGKKGRKDYVPFGPSLALGAAIAPYFGDWLISRYGF